MKQDLYSLHHKVQYYTERGELEQKLGIAVSGYLIRSSNEFSRFFISSGIICDVSSMDLNKQTWFINR